jgi:diamine N-acetyltransferase
MKIELTKDFKLVAKLNYEIQKHHIDLYEEYFRETKIEEVENYYKNQLEDPNWFCYIAYIDEEPIGYALFFIRNYEQNPFRKSYLGIHIDQISVLPRYKKQGIGTALMATIENFAKDKNATQLELTYWENNVEAKMFYEKLGFNPHMRFTVKRI